MRNKINRKQRLAILLPILGLILGTAFAVFPFHPLKASEEETTLVSVELAGKPIKNQVTTDDTVVTLTAQEDSLIRLPYGNQYEVTLLDEAGEAQAFPLLAPQNVDLAQFEQGLADKEKEATTTSTSETATNLARTEAESSYLEADSVYQVGEATQGDYYLALIKGQSVSLRVQRKSTEALPVKIWDARDKNRVQSLFTFAAKNPDTDSDALVTTETENPATQAPSQATAEAETSEAPVSETDPNAQIPGVSREAVQLYASIDNQEIQDGTPGWDANDEPGNDSNANNGIVRSFDTITYPLQITVNPSGMHNIALKISGKLKNGVYKDRVQAVFEEGGNQDPLKDGEVTFTKDFTINQTGSAVTFPVNVNVLGAFNGVDLTLSDISVAIMSIDGVPQETPVKMSVPDTKPIKTSSQVSFNIRASASFGGGAQSEYYLRTIIKNKELDALHTLVNPLSVSFEAVPLTGKTDMKGSSFPTGEIKYSVNAIKKVNWDEGGQTVVPVTESNKMKIFDYRKVYFTNINGPIIKENGKGSLAELNKYEWQIPYVDSIGFANSYLQRADQALYCVYNSGDLLLQGESSLGTYDFSMKDYEIGNTFPTRRSDNYLTFTAYTVNQKGFATWQHIVTAENEYYAGSPLNPDKRNNNEEITYAVDVSSYVDQDGKEVEYKKTAKTNSVIRNTINGTLSINNSFISPVSPYLEYGTQNTGDSSIPFGDGMVISNSIVGIRGRVDQTFSSNGSRIALLNWNTDSFEFYNWENTPGLQTSYSSIEGSKVVKDSMKFYGVSKSKDSNTIKKLGLAQLNDYDWYATKEEALNNGEIGALKIEITDEQTFSSVASISWIYNLKLKSGKLGSISKEGTPNIAVAQYWVDPLADGNLLQSNQPVTSPAMYNEDNQLIEQQIPRGSPCRFDTLAVTDMITRTTIKADKTNYYSNERQKFTIDSSITMPDSFQEEAPVTLTVTIPKGLSVVPSTVLYGGKPVEVSLIYNPDGTTTMEYTTKVKVGEKILPLTYEANVNNAEMNYNGAGLASVINKVVISSPYDTSLESLRTSQFTTNVTKIGQLGINQKIDPTKIEVNGTFAISILPYTTTEREQGVAGIWNLPENEDELNSEFTGTIAISKVESVGNKAKRIYLNKNHQTETDPNKIKLDDGWELYDALSSPISDYHAVYYVFEDDITATDSQNIGVKITMQTNGNVPDDYYRSVARGNSLTNYAVEVESNMVQATVVGRTLSGVAWYDQNLDGLIDDGEALAANIPVTLYRDGELVTENLVGDKFIDAKGDATIVTDAQGYYAFTKLPAGNYVAEFMIAGQIQRKELKITKEFAGGEAETALNSKANPETRQTPRYEMPALAELNGLYQVEHVNVGLIQPSEIRLFKYAQGTETGGHAETGLPLAGAEFALYAGTEVTGAPLATATTDAQGNLVFDHLFPGDYTLVETKAPTGYELIKTPIAVTIDQSDQVIQLAQADPKVTELPFTGGTNPTQLLVLLAAGISVIGMGCLGFTYLQPKKGRRVK